MKPLRTAFSIFFIMISPSYAEEWGETYITKEASCGIGFIEQKLKRNESVTESDFHTIAQTCSSQRTLLNRKTVKVSAFEHCTSRLAVRVMDQTGEITPGQYEKVKLYCVGETLKQAKKYLDNN